MTIIAVVFAFLTGGFLGFIIAALAAAASHSDDFDRGYQAGQRTKDNPQ